MSEFAFGFAISEFFFVFFPFCSEFRLLVFVSGESSDEKRPHLHAQSVIFAFLELVVLVEIKRED